MDHHHWRMSTEQLVTRLGEDRGCGEQRRGAALLYRFATFFGASEVGGQSQPDLSAANYVATEFGPCILISSDMTMSRAWRAHFCALVCARGCMSARMLSYVLWVRAAALINSTAG